MTPGLTPGLTATPLISNVSAGDPLIPSIGAFLDDFGYHQNNKSTFAAHLMHASYVTIITKSDDIICGALVYRMTGDEAEIIEIAVDKTKRQQGLATNMMDYLCQLACLENCQRLLLEVADNNLPAKAFYTQYGFVIIGQRPAYYNKQIDALIMELWLSKA